MQRAIVISALRRSGTTALWQCFRGQAGVAAFDEPFHPRLAAGARYNPKGTWAELAAFLGPPRGTSGDKSRWQPVGIGPLAELDPASTPGETAYFEALLSAAPRVVIDEVRIWNRLPALYTDPDAVLTVHLIRDPGSWVTGHLLPSGAPTVRRRIADIYRRWSFFNRRGFFDNYHYQTIIAAALEKNHPMWKAVAIPVVALRTAPAYVKLLAFWWASNLTQYQRLAEAGAARMLVTLEEFSREPGLVLNATRALAGWQDLDLSCHHVRPTRAAVGATDPRWYAAARSLGIPEALCAPGGASAAALTMAFDQALADGWRGG